MEVNVVTGSLTEEVTVAEINTITGYSDTDQDTRIALLITVAREWLEARTGVSALSKSYKAYFEKGDRDRTGYYELPFSPVTGVPVVSVCGVATTEFDSVGMDRKRIRPSTSYATVPVGGTSPYYVEVTFTAGASSKLTNECIRRIVVSMFNNPEDGAEVSMSRLPFDTLRLIESINQNTGL